MAIYPYTQEPKPKTEISTAKVVFGILLSILLIFLFFLWQKNNDLKAEILSQKRELEHTIRGQSKHAVSLKEIDRRVEGLETQIRDARSGDIVCENCIELAKETKGNFVATIKGNNQIEVTGSGNENATILLSIAPDSIGNDQLAFDTGQHLTTSSSPTFNSLYLSSLNISFSKFVVDSNGNITKISNVSYSWPSSQGSANTILQNNGSGILTWATIGSASITPDSLDFTEFKDDLTLDNDLTIFPSGANYSINIDSGTFYVDTANNRIGIGTTTPSYTLDIAGAIRSTGNLTAPNVIYSVSGTTRRITSSGGQNPVIDIASNYAGQTSIITLGTITTGTWHGAIIETAYGGTGLSSIGAANQILGVNSGATSLEYKNIASLLSAGTGISITGTDNATIANTGILSLTAGSGISISSGQNPTISNTGVLSLNSLTGFLTLQGTTNQINVSSGGATITLSTPQDIHTGASPTFAGLTLYGLTQGSVLFTGTGGAISQDNANLFWDNTNKRLGIGTTTPNNAIQVANLINFDNTDYNTKLGYQAGLNIVSGAQYNTFVGYQAGLSSATGSTNGADYNTAIGSQALYSNTTGYHNTAIGYQALYSNTTGYRNTAIGSQALSSNTTGYQNTAIGYQALYSNTTGDQNTAIGFLALSSNTTGMNNTAIGYLALSSNTTGYQNTAIGSQALYSNTTGYQNTAIGSQALYSNTTGSSNVALGYGAGYYETGSNKLYIANNSNLNNALIYGEFDNKRLALLSNVTVANTSSLGSEKVANGDFSTVPDTSWTWGTGWSHDTTNYEADHATGNTVALEQNISAVAGEVYYLSFTVKNRTTGSVTPQIGGVNGTSVDRNITSTQIITARGTENLKFIPTSNFNGSIDNVSVKRITGGDLAVAGLLTGGGTSGIKIDTSGNVGIGTTPGTKLAVYGLTGTASYNLVRVDTATGNFYYDTSTQRNKENIQTLEEDFFKILEVQPKSFTDKSSGLTEIGYIAEDFDQIGLKNLVIYDKEGLPDGLKYDKIPLYLLEVIKKQQKDIAELQQVTTNTQQTTNPFKIQYDSSNYLSIFVNQDGEVSLDATGKAAKIVFQSPVVIKESLTIGQGGTPITGHISKTITWDPPLFANNEVVSTTIAIAEAMPGDIVYVSHDKIGANDVIISAHVQEPGIVRVILRNVSGKDIDIESGTLRVSLWKY